jgi:multiple sugar transport system permease protein
VTAVVAPEAPAAGRVDTRPRTTRGSRWSRLWAGRRRYLVGAVCVAVSTIMLLPLLASVLASIKPTAEAAQTPPTFVPHGFSLDSYRRLWEYQSGLPTYLLNSLGTALLTVLFTLILTTLAGYGLARFPIPMKEPLFVILLLALIIPYQALLTPIFLMFSDLGLANSLVGLAIIHTAIQLPFSVYIMRNSFEAVPRELEEAAMIDGAHSGQILLRIFMPAAVPAIITVALFAFITSWNEFLAALVMMNSDSKFTLPLILSTARTATSLGGTDWGMLQAGVTISIIPCVVVYLLLQRYFVAGFLSGAVK